jgi:hypothetical protein
MVRKSRVQFERDFVSRHRAAVMNGRRSSEDRATDDKFTLREAAQFLSAS